MLKRLVQTALGNVTLCFGRALQVYQVEIKKKVGKGFYVERVLPRFFVRIVVNKDVSMKITINIID